MSFSRVYKTYTFGGGGGLCENQYFFRTLLTFWPDLYYNFHGDFWHSKMLMCTLFLGGGEESHKVYGLYTRENVYIYGRPLTVFQKMVALQECGSCRSMAVVGSLLFFGSKLRSMYNFNTAGVDPGGVHGVRMTTPAPYPYTIFFFKHFLIVNLNGLVVYKVMIQMYRDE